jgi:hypothetical protein
MLRGDAIVVEAHHRPKESPWWYSDAPFLHCPHFSNATVLRLEHASSHAGSSDARSMVRCIPEGNFTVPDGQSYAHRIQSFLRHLIRATARENQAWRVLD